MRKLGGRFGRLQFGDGLLFCTYSLLISTKAKRGAAASDDDLDDDDDDDDDCGAGGGRRRRPRGGAEGSSGKASCSAANSRL